MRLLIASLAIVIALAASDMAAAQQAVHWATFLSLTFPIRADLPDWPISCTGWYAAPRGRVGSMLVSLYVTAGHCDLPHIVRNADGLEQMAILARVTRPGLDATVGARLDPRGTRAFPVLATTLPETGDQALVAGYSAGHLTEAVLTTLPKCRHGFVCFHSDHALRPGMSGAPILSLRTGEVIGMLLGTPVDSHGYSDAHTIWAVPSISLRPLIEIASPTTPET